MFLKNSLKCLFITLCLTLCISDVFYANTDDLLYPGKKIETTLVFYNTTNSEKISDNIFIDLELKDKNNNPIERNSIEYNIFVKNATIKLTYKNSVLLEQEVNKVLGNRLNINTIKTNPNDKTDIHFELYLDKEVKNEIQGIKVEMLIKLNDILSNSTLVQTGYVIGTGVYLIIASILIVVGIRIVIIKRKK